MQQNPTATPLQADIELIRAWQRSPKQFIKDVWGLTPERNNQLFIKGRHITWQQDDFLIAVEKAIAGLEPKRISVRSGHGVGKTTTLSWLIIWYLICHLDAQVPCTAPTATQMNDILWKEVFKWIEKMPLHLRQKLEWTSGYVRVTERPETWFARAKTAAKEQPEALAGVHGDFVMYIVDEASGVPEEIFNTAEGALTSGAFLFIMISNPTRLIGYFFDSHHSDKENWQTLSFNGIESPIVDMAYVKRIRDKHGEDSDEYAIRVAGEFGAADTVDSKGYVPLIAETDIHYTSNADMRPERRLGIDPSGEGKDKTTWVLRDQFKAKIVAEEDISDEKGIAAKTLTLMDYFDIKDSEVTIDNFGVGANVAKHLALAGKNVNSVNVGDEASEPSNYINIRAESFWRARTWLRSGGELVTDVRWSELTNIRYCRELSNRLKIMSKKEMRKQGIPSPNFADGLMLTFVKSEQISTFHDEPFEFQPPTY